MVAKKKAIVNILDTPMKLCMRTFSALANPDNSHRKDVFNTYIREVKIDTVCAHDTHIWETGINRNDGKDWIIVEQYPNRDAAKAGHRYWCTKIKVNPKRTLFDIFLEEDIEL